MTAMDNKTQTPSDSNHDLWGEFLDGIEFEKAENGVQPGVTGQASGRVSKGGAGRGKARSGLFGLSKPQTVIVGILLIAVLLVWCVLITVVVRSVTSSVATQLVTEAERLSETAVTQAQTAITPQPTWQPGGPTATPGGDVTPFALPAIATQYDVSILKDPDNYELRLSRGQTYIQLGAYQEAIDDYRHASSTDPARPEAYVGLGWASFNLRQWKPAESYFLKSLGLDPEQTAARMGLGQLRYYQGRYAEAAALYERIVQIQPEDAESQAWLALSAARHGDVERAMVAATEAISLTRDLPLAYIARSWLYRRQTPPDLDAAQGDLLYARNLAPYKFETLNALAEFYLSYRLERLNEAEQLALYALNWAKTDLERAIGLHTLGRIYLEQSRLSEAETVLQQAFDLVSTDESFVLPDLASDLERARQP